MNKLFQLLVLTSITCILLTMSSFCYALPFAIFPKTTLPTKVVSGSSVTAFYTVQNLTASERPNNYVKFLPPNVTQITSDPTISDLCNSSFNLAAKGVSGDSCTLELKVTGAVNASDTDPHHRLFVCFPMGKTCAGTEYPLNVNTVTTQYAYIGNDGPNKAGTNNFINICQINTDGSLTSCIQQTDPSNTIFKGPVDIVVNSSATRAYVLNINGGVNSFIQNCLINGDGTLALESCSSTSISQNALYGGLHPNGLFLYVSSSNLGVQVCSINTDGSIGTCNSTGTGFNEPNGRIAFNPAGTIAYVANFITNNVTYCQVGVNGSLTNCNTLTPNPSSRLLGVNVDSSGSFLYVASRLNNIYSCQITNNPNPGAFDTNCTLAGTGFDFNGDVCNFFLAKNQLAYIPNEGSSAVSLCNASSGLLTNCSTIPGSFSNPTSVWFNN